MRTFARESAIALGLFAALLGWSHRAVLSGAHVSSFSAGLPAEKTIRGIYEMVYQEAPAHWTAADMVRRGVFPSWTPYAEAGTPLIGKMQNAIFSPFRLHYYLVPERLMGWAQSLMPPLTALFAFVFIFLYARLLGAAWPWAAAAGAFYVFSGSMLAGHALFADNPSALFLPALLALIELSSRRDGASYWLMPWAAALSLICGHFETAIRNLAVAGFCFLHKLKTDRALDTAARLDRLVAFGAAMAGGLALAAFQILPGVSYVGLSYNKVWRALPEFGWRFQTVQKMVTGEDAAALAVGFCAAAAALWLSRLWLRESDEAWKPRPLALVAGAGCCGAVAVAALSSCGLDVTGTTLVRMPNGLWGAGVGVFLLSAAGACATRPGTAARALAWVWGGACVVLLKTPLVADALARLPLVGSFNNTIYAPEYDAARVILAALALQALAQKARLPLPERLRAAARGGVALAAAFLAVAGGEVLRAPLARATGGSVGIHRTSAQPNGGVIAPSRGRVFSGGYELVGWVTSRAPVESLSVAAGDQTAVPARWDGESGERRWFRARVPIPEGGAPITVLAKMRDGREGRLDGPRLEAQALPRGELAALAALPLLPLSPWLAPAAAAAAALKLAKLTEPPTVPAGQFPLRLPGVDFIKKDASLFRIDSLQYGFLQADYPNLYGLSDIRNGGDNLDLLPMIYLLFLKNDLAGREDKESRAAAARIGSLLNVKYVVGPPEAAPGPGLKEVYRGPDMAVYENTAVRPRASFYEQARRLPLADMKDWRGEGRKVFADVGKTFLEPGFDPFKTLLLHEEPVAPPPAARPTSAAAPRVELVEYEANRAVIHVTAPRPGYVLLADNLAPGWKADLDGRRVEILRAFLTLRAVAVPAGLSTLTFAYAPLDLAAGVPLSLLALAAWALLFWRRARLPASAPPSQAPAPAKKKKAAAAVVVEESPESAEVELWLKRALLALIAPCLIYWLWWAAFRWDAGPVRRWRGTAAPSAPRTP